VKRWHCAFTLLLRALDRAVDGPFPVGGVKKLGSSRGVKKLGSSRVKFKIDMKDPDAVFGIQPHSHSRSVQEVIDNNARVGLKTGFMEKAPADPAQRLHPIKHCTPWSGNKRCACLDSTVLSPHTVAVPMQVLTTHMVQARIPAGTKYFFSSDCAQAFYIVEVEESSHQFLTFPALGGWYRYTRMPFGPMNAPAYFDQLMMEVIDDSLRDCALHHVDDVLGFGSDMDVFQSNFVRILERLDEFEMPLKASKTRVGVTETWFVGRVLKDGAVYASPESLDGVLNVASCKNPRAARSLVGVVRWIVYFVPNLATLLQPFTALTGNVPFEWREELHEPALDALKTAVRNHVGNSFVKGTIGVL
jgi:hypothetical protein